MDSASLHSEVFDSPAEALRRIESNLATLDEPQADQASEAAVLHLQAAHICLGQTEEVALGKALEHLRLAWQQDPQRTDVRMLLIRTLEQAGQQEELAHFLWEASAVLKEDQEQTMLQMRAARLFQQLGETEQALEIMRAIQQSRCPPEPSSNREALTQLAVQLEKVGQVDQEIEVRWMMLSLLPEEGRYSCLRRIALLELQAERAELAQEAYAGALELQPGSAEALQPVLSYLEEKQDFEGIEKVLLAAAVARAVPHERCDLWRRLAQLVEAELGEHRRAIDYWWSAWEAGPNGEETDNLKRLCTQLKDWERYYQVLQREVKIAPDPRTKVEIFRELATFQREVLQDDRTAAEIYHAILQLCPDDAFSHAARIEIFAKLEMKSELHLALHRSINHCTDPHLKEELLQRLVGLEFNEGNDLQLPPLLGRMDQQSDGTRRFVQELWETTRASQRPQTALAVGAFLLQLQQTTKQDHKEQVESLLGLGDLCLQLKRYGQATDYYRQVLEFQGDHLEARTRLKDIDRRGQLFDPTAVMLAMQAEDCAAQHPRRAIRLLIQAAHVVEHQPHPDAEAIARYLRRAVRLCSPDAWVEVQLLEGTLRSAGLFAELVQILKMQAEQEVDPLARKSLLRALAQVYHDELHDTVQAVEVLAQLRELDPYDLEPAEQIRLLYSALGNYQALAEVLENLLSVASGRGRIPLLAELGKLYAQNLDDQTSALGRYGELLSFVPDHAAALAFCRAHDEAAGEYRSIVVLLCRAAEAAVDPLERAEFHHEIAQIAEQRLGDLDFAIAQWRKVIELCPADTAPRGELRRILKEVGRWREVAEALLSDVARSLSPEDKVPIYIELAHVSKEHLGDERTAAGYLRLAQQLASTNTGILSELEVIFENLGQWHELVVVLQRHAELETAMPARVKLLNKAARTLFIRLKREDEALAICRYIREMSAGDRISATLMGEILSVREQWRELISLWREQVQEESDPSEQGRIYFELGHLLLEKNKDPSGASTCFEHALELDAGRGEVLPLLRSLYEAQGQWEQLIDLIRRRTAAEGVSIPEKVNALCEMGRITEEQLGDAENARKAYERALHLDATHAPAITALRALALSRGDWREVVRLARQELPILEDSTSRSEILLEIATILREKLDRPRAAIEALEEAVAENPANTEAATRLADICFEEEDWARVSDLLENVVESGLELNNLHEYFYRLGFACERLGRVEDAFSYYVKSFGQEPLYLPTLDRLVELCYERRQWDNTLRITEAIVTTYADQKTSRELADLYFMLGLSQLHLAQLEVAVQRSKAFVLEPGQSATAPQEAWLDAAEDWASTPLEQQLTGGIPLEFLERVVKAMERCLKFQDDHFEGLQVLAALCFSRHDWERGLKYLERATGVSPRDLKIRAALLVCGGDIAFHQLHAKQRAEAFFREALSLLPGFPLAQERMSRLQSGPPPTPLPPSGAPLPPAREIAATTPPPIPGIGKREAAEPAKKQVLRVDTPPPPPSFNEDQAEDISMPTIPIMRSAPRSKPLIVPKKDPQE